MCAMRQVVRRHVLAFLITMSVAAAQNVSEYQVKAAYLYNFAKMTRWPAEALAENAPLVIGVYGGDEEFVGILRRTLAGKTINAHALEVRRVHEMSELRSCHLVFVRARGSNAELAIAAAQPGNLLLVGEDYDFLNHGGMISFVVHEHRVKFEINSDSLQRAKLRFEESGKAESQAGNAAEPGSRAVALRVSPLYPDVARRMNVAGAVQLQVVVRADGSVKDVRVVGGHPLLGDAATRAVKQWRFQPSARETTEHLRIDFGD